MAVFVAPMTPNGDEDNEDDNSKNNDKATTKPKIHNNQLLRELQRQGTWWQRQ
jgi:hypothetical protein